tara:strand:+ start:14767 stop:15210 length:444 start_codon:yes stop_codon:yes gene_type:complete
MKLLLKETYLAMAKNSPGSKIFQTLLAEVDGEEVNILKGGDVSCAYFVSTLLKIFDLVKTPHATVSGLEKDLMQSGWSKSEEMIPGAILIWKATAQAGDEMHEHVGIYLGNDVAVSNSYKELVPVEHHATFDNKRKVRAIYTHTFLL